MHALLLLRYAKMTTLKELALQAVPFPVNKQISISQHTIA